MFRKDLQGQPVPQVEFAFLAVRRGAANRQAAHTRSVVARVCR